MLTVRLVGEKHLRVDGQEQGRHLPQLPHAADSLGACEKSFLAVYDQS